MPVCETNINSFVDEENESKSEDGHYYQRELPRGDRATSSRQMF